MRQAGRYRSEGALHDGYDNSVFHVTDLLPRAEHHARDLGIVNVSASLGQLLGPLLGAGAVALVGGFWLLFLAAGILSVLGSLMTVMVHPAQALQSPDQARR